MLSAIACFENAHLYHFEERMQHIDHCRDVAMQRLYSTQWMENLTDFVNAFLHWLIGALESILSWSIICVQAIASVVYFLYIAVIK